MQPPSKFRDWASMARLPNVPTVWSNIFTAGVLGVTGGTYAEISDVHILPAFLTFTPLFAGGAFLYIGGAVLGDVSDLEVDALSRPERPLPSGRIPVRTATLAGWGLWAGGGLLFLLLRANFLPLAMLMGTIVAYSRIHKHHPWLAIPLMGLCRAFLALTVVGMIYEWDGNIGASEWLWSLAYFKGLLVYVSAISFLALGEVNPSRRKLVGWLLALLPAVDAVYLVAAGLGSFLVLPLLCFVFALLLRRWASAT